MTISIRATTALIALFALASGCAMTPGGFVVNGRFVSDTELVAYQSSWQSGSTTATQKSSVPPKNRQDILNVIAHQEATGGTRAGECSSLALADVIPVRSTHLRDAAGQTFGPLDFVEHWRVLACGNKHSWFVFEESGFGRKPTAVFMQLQNDDWAQFKLIEQKR